MNAFYFGAPARRLFGMYHAADLTAGSPRAAVLCNSWGPDYIHSHRTVRQAAIQLAAAGFHVLRFDYFGTGDSAGNMTDASLSVWEDDIRTAMNEVLEMSGASRVMLVGLRFGAALAARVAAAGPEKIEKLLLWDPVLSGSAYLDELFYNCRTDPQAFRELRSRPAAAGGGHELHGFQLSDAMARDIRRIDLCTVRAALPPQCAVLISGPERDEIRARELLVPPLASASIDRVPAMPCWIDPWPYDTRSLPVTVLNRLVERAKGMG